MSKMGELAMLLDDVIETGNSFLQAVAAVRAYVNTDGRDALEQAVPVERPTDMETDIEEVPLEETPTAAPAARAYTKEEVRGILARKANEAEGRYRTEVKTIVRRYGKGGSLTDIAENDYPALVAEIERLTHE